MCFNLFLQINHIIIISDQYSFTTILIDYNKFFNVLEKKIRF